jgi:hypothetical protein
MPYLKKINVLTRHDPLKPVLNQYIKEIKYLKFYILAVALVVILSYSVYIFFSVETVSNLGAEDHFFEWLTPIFFWIASAIFFLTFLKTKNLFFLILAIVMFIGAGEEISWGQRIFGFKTPESINKINVQHEFTFHNIAIFQGVDSQGKPKYGLSRLLEINFLFRFCTMLCGIVLPFCVYHIKFISRLTMKIRVPIPPIAIGLFFFISWVTYWGLHSFILPKDSPQAYISAAGEIYECIASFILLTISLYFYNNYKIVTIGKDIKQII